jgi:hypothetical protein
MRSLSLKLDWEAKQKNNNIFFFKWGVRIAAMTRPRRRNKGPPEPHHLVADELDAAVATLAARERHGCAVVWGEVFLKRGAGPTNEIFKGLEKNPRQSSIFSEQSLEYCTRYNKFTRPQIGRKPRARRRRTK